MIQPNRLLGHDLEQLMMKEQILTNMMKEMKDQMRNMARKQAKLCDDKVSDEQVSTRILGRRTAPFTTFVIFLTASRMVLPNILVLTHLRHARAAVGCANAGSELCERHQHEHEVRELFCAPVLSEPV